MFYCNVFHHLFCATLAGAISRCLGMNVAFVLRTMIGKGLIIMELGAHPTHDYIAIHLHTDTFQIQLLVCTRERQARV